MRQIRRCIASEMKAALLKRVLLAVCAIALLSLTPAASSQSVSCAPATGLAQSIRAHMDYLAGDALGGRGSATPQEYKAAEYVASELRRYGVRPAGDDGGYLQHIALEYRSLAAPPVLSFETPAADGSKPEQSPDEGAPKLVRWTHGDELAVVSLGRPNVSGPLQKLDSGDPKAQVKPGAVVLLTSTDESRPLQQAYDVANRGAVLVLVPDSPSLGYIWEGASEHLPRIAPRITALPDRQATEGTEAVIRESAAKMLLSIPEGTIIHLEAQFKPPRAAETRNVVGVIRGSDPKLRDQAILFSAHIDHLGMRKNGKHTAIYHGADDDASGVSAVLELARALAAGPPPRRTVLFALFGSEEIGELGSTYFAESPPVPLPHIVAALEFEMIGRPDNAIPPHTLWLSGFGRSDLGRELAAHGVPIVPDPHSGEHFFERSDNYPLARDGVVAHTVSSYGLHRDYHRPSDNLAHIDFLHLTEAVESMIRGAAWLANSDFTPHWLPGQKP